MAQKSEWLLIIYVARTSPVGGTKTAIFGVFSVYILNTLRYKRDAPIYKTPILLEVLYTPLLLWVRIWVRIAPVTTGY